METEMDNRGSKSSEILRNTSNVKEQRVDGSYGRINSIPLRYTLMVFERNSRLKILSNNIQNNKKFSTINLPSINNKIDLPTPKIVPISFNPWYLTGLIDGEGSFIVRIKKNSKYKRGWSISLVFSIYLHKNDLPLLEGIKFFF